MPLVTRAVFCLGLAAACLAPRAGEAADGAPRLKLEGKPEAAAPAGAAGAATSPRRALRPAPATQTAPQRNTAEMVALGIRHAHGEGVARDHGKANELFCAAAMHGEVEGWFNLGWSYANGRGVARDDNVAVRLFQHAAERGHEHAAKLLDVITANAEARLPDCLLPPTLLTAGLHFGLPGFENLPHVRMPVAPREIALLVQRLAPQFEIDVNLALAVIAVESGFNAAAVSRANAQGLMQLIPETARRFGVQRPFNPDENVRGGLAYLRWLLAYFQGNLPLVLAAYNAGEGAVEKYRGIPPFAETQDYVRKIVALYRRVTHPYNGGVVAPSPLMKQILHTM